MASLRILAALLVVPLAGCEIGLLIAAVTDEPPPDYYDPNAYTYCNEFSGSGVLSGPLPSAEALASLHTVGAVAFSSPLAPTGRLASGEQLDFFVVATALEAGPDVALEVRGDLERLDESSGACVPSAGEGAASFVSVETGGSGEGAIVLLDEGDEYDRFDFTVVPVVGISISLEVTGVRATLFDEDGNAVFAHAGVEWEFVPSSVSMPVRGLVAPLLNDGLHQETQVTVYFQDLEATTTLRLDSSTGLWAVAE
jgi:hypothetical protein